MTFEDYWTSKKVDSDAYQATEPHQWEEFKSIFKQMHPKSFTMQKLNLINGLRRRFPLTEEPLQKESLKPKVTRPVLKKKDNQTIPSKENQRTKPVMKPKASTAKPKITKPVVKPKINPDQNKKDEPVVRPKPIIKKTQTDGKKPKVVRPIIKPKTN